MQIKALGHAVLRVRNLARSVAFYRDLLGMREVARYRGKMVFFSLGANHHDLALLEIGERAADADPHAVGLYHLAFKVGDSLDALRAVKAELEEAGVTLLGMSDHKVSQSIYIEDPDGIELELYVDADPSVWRDDPAALAYTGPLNLA